jgi:hypothetical protein
MKCLNHPNILSYHKKRPLYVIFNGKKPGIYISFEELVTLKTENRELLWKKYVNIDEALTQARIRCGMNYYIEPAAREYMQKYKIGENINLPGNIPNIVIKEEGSSSKKTYKETLVQEASSPDDGLYTRKLEEKLEKIYPVWKKEIKEEILNEVTQDIKQKFDKMKKEYDDIYRILEDDIKSEGNMDLDKS